MDLPIHLLAVLARNRFLALPVAFALCVLIGVAVRRRTGRSASWGALVLLLAMLNIMAGPSVSAWLIHRFGRSAAAQTTGTYQTSTRYNGHAVMGYRVVIRLSDTKTVDEHFEDDDLNFYPVAEDTTFPRAGDTYTVRVLPEFPHDFVIVTDDDSAWARHLACGRLGSRLVEARRRFTFAGGAPAFRAPYADAITAYVDRDCANGPEDAALYRHDRERALTGVVDP